MDAQLLEIRKPSVGLVQGKQAGNFADLTEMETVERDKIIEVLKETNYNKVETAKRLGIGRQTLYNKIKAYEISVALC